MKLNVYTMKQQTQEFFLRLFVEPDSELSTPSSSIYLCARSSTHTRMYK